MARTTIPGGYRNFYFQLSTDEKPTDDNVPNASELYEMDVQKIYLYDAENKIWVQQ